MLMTTWPIGRHDGRFADGRVAFQVLSPLSLLRSNERRSIKRPFRPSRRNHDAHDLSAAQSTHRSDSLQHETIGCSNMCLALSNQEMSTAIYTSASNARRSKHELVAPILFFPMESPGVKPYQRGNCNAQACGHDGFRASKAEDVVLATSERSWRELTSRIRWG